MHRLARVRLLTRMRALMTTLNLSTSDRLSPRSHAVTPRTPSGMIGGPR